MWEITIVASGKRGVITQSKGKGCLDVKEGYQSGWNEIMDKANTTTPALTVSKVLGMIGLPAPSFRAVTFAAQRMVVMLMKTELFAIDRKSTL